ncbi:unnamed protein product [Didymodactylos carnosus]|uniref:Elongation factor 1-gamma n=1 Tax=Didymodactylos carnosus TaxID=1234261 RepID=A0A813Y9I2_9BILA|nr:unnamed protein product [Didymodactylos carnosus]CAF0881032.1 unnamed protein product [Didymodactylos carnosus]CAF3539788.1 unnamed protein product [Didymodactylos carnosus]CAF3667203.1 unnamed protein product [Didymodactylos carnosus]
MSNTGNGTLYTYPGNFRAYKAQIAAQYSGARLTVASTDKFKMNETNKSEEYLKKFPTGKVPAYENDAGVRLFECNAIAHYLSNQQLRGKTLEEQSSVIQWIEYAEREIIPVSATLVYPCMGIMQFNKLNHERAKDELKHILHLLNEYLRTRTYLAGERITLADIVVACDLLLLFQWIVEPAQRTLYPNTTRWFLTLIHQDEVKTVIGDYKLCEKMAQFDPKKFAEVSEHSQQHSQHRDEHHQESTKDKKGDEKKSQQQAQGEKPAKQKGTSKPKDEQEHGDDQGGDEMDDVLAQEPKQKDPFAEMAKGTFNMDEFKRVYSNEDTVTKAIPHFWSHFDKENYSLWQCEYKYPEDLGQIFMTCNLVAGMFQRLEKLRKNAFASMCVWGKDKDNTISGVWTWRGQGLAFELSPDWQTDYESYTWTKLNPDDEKTKKMVEQFFAWEGEHKGKTFNQGKIFK